MMASVHSTNLHSLKLLHKGKVRDNYIVDDKHLLMITTDRISAFDVILNEPIPHKGKVLNQMALFWFDFLDNVIHNHLTSIPVSSVVTESEFSQVKNRSVVVKRLKPILIEAVVRGYMAGSAWKDYQANNSICKIELPLNMHNSQKFSEPIFTPASKAEMGEHDENISFEKMKNNIGSELAILIRDKSIELYTKASEFALTKGIIIADTKFEFGLDDKGNLVLMDEILTPDSSRFWDISSYKLDINPPSFDKQFVRDWLETQAWDKISPAPNLPEQIAYRTSEKYIEAFKKITGKELLL
jgi:phosphoribosylaminoimidazole-succinocarboxamide synthase